ncbi:hypothetical protein ACLMAL_32890 [Nocardia sp. CWNU-33]|uniref:hypothetical protein n=1 Tax=Nocardia sp. CWNU-33 TaxID=3392117 RepID=UPI00398EEF43
MPTSLVRWWIWGNYVEGKECSRHRDRIRRRVRAGSVRSPRVAITATQNMAVVDKFDDRHTYGGEQR